MILLFRNPVLAFHANKLSPLNKKILTVKNMRNFVIFIISRVFFIRLTSSFYHKIALIFKLSILHTIRHDNYYEMVYANLRHHFKLILL